MADSTYNCFLDDQFLSLVNQYTRGFPLYEFYGDSCYPEEGEEPYIPDVVDAEGWGYKVEVNRNVATLRPCGTGYTPYTTACDYSYARRT